MRSIIEPFRIKSVEPIKMTTKEERVNLLKQAHYNPFLIRAEDIIIDLLTDSGTSAMSAQQWGAMMVGDESYAGSRSYYHFEETIKDIFGFDHVLPTHQGRAAERILFGLMEGKGKFIPNNTHFDTTRANCEMAGFEAVDLVIPEGSDPSLDHPFKGNMDTEKLDNFITEKGAINVPFAMITITNNSGGGQPVSMGNIREVSKICKKHGIPLMVDACRFAENCYFIKMREKGFENRSVKEIAHELFSYADGCTMSAKKDAMVNIGGFLCMNNTKWLEKAKNNLILTEGFPTYGGLAGRDLEAIAVGLKEVLDENYLNYRYSSTKYLGTVLDKHGVPYLKPVGGHAIYLDAKAFLPHIPLDKFPGQSLVCELYLEGGIRSVEIGSLMFGKTHPDTGEFLPAKMELVRLAIPRRVYTQSHIDYVGEVIVDVFKNRESIKPLTMTYEPPFLRHFTVRFTR